MFTSQPEGTCYDGTSNKCQVRAPSRKRSSLGGYLFGDMKPKVELLKHEVPRQPCGEASLRLGCYMHDAPTTSKVDQSTRACSRKFNYRIKWFDGWENHMLCRLG